ncbi:Protein notum homologue [Plasmopara halstedii]|uniref:Protein notum homologue n=1 Tax=Plasmopara halstedii TaxID=4781 RepID=A0A0P1B1V3_PLAHL|nr:Protein notum homologue [Plasmopara halstedii]CEG48414.1 Protein notum homologue [Plasmopara halstedii]|eukprot:XP_024584783.1 Protein notum homologue [Plasmopara halstedii]
MVVYAQATKTVIALLTLPLLSSAHLSKCHISDSNTCDINSLSPSTDGSVFIYPGGTTRCAFDDYTDTVSSFQSNSTYFFQVFPAVNQSKNKLLLFFQGGGACVGKYTCDFTLQCQLGDDSLISTRATVTEKGIMNRHLGDNVFNDFNIVYLPYCTGDLFVGNKYLEPFENMYSQGLENKQCLGQNKGMHLNGYNNTMAVIKWALDNYPNPEQIVIGGYSAGSLGAQLWSTFVAKAWNVETKATKFQVLADSYVGVFPEFNRPASSLVNFYGGCRLLNFPDSIVSTCEAETATAVDLVSSLMKETLSGQWLFINSIGDETQRMFYELVLLGIAGFPFTQLRPVDEFYGNLTAMLNVYSSFMDVTRFDIDSEEHVWLTRDDYRSVKRLDGQLLGDVMSAWLSNNHISFSGVYQASPGFQTR